MSPTSLRHGRLALKNLQNQRALTARCPAFDLVVHQRAHVYLQSRLHLSRKSLGHYIHKILKSGCKVEESKLRTAERLVNLISTFCILSWRIFWLTMLNRTVPQATPTLAFTKLELQLLDRLTKLPVIWLMFSRLPAIWRRSLSSEATCGALTILRPAIS